MYRSNEGPVTVFVLIATVTLMIGCDAHMTALETEDVVQGSESGEFEMRGPSAGLHSTSDLHWFTDMTKVQGETARLVRTSDAIRTRTNTTGLDHHHVMTMWWVIFNYPEYCDGACGEADLFDGPDGPTGVQPSCIFTDGSIVGGNGQARFQDRLAVGESRRDSCIDFFVEADDGLEGRDYGLQNPEGAEIHLVVRSHGPLIPGLVKEQRMTFAGGCTGLLPAGETDLQEGECSDQQFAVFPAPGH